MGASIRDRVHQLADQLPPGATLEDAIERLVFEAKVDRGLVQGTPVSYLPRPTTVHEPTYAWSA